MRHLPVVSSVRLLALVVSASPALADEPARPVDDSPKVVTTPASATYDLGFRVGGYGFRRATNRMTETPQPGAEVTGDWTECRMNGFGLFTSRTLPGPLFVEVGLDAYFSKGQAPASDLPIDRASGLVSTAIGARSNFTSWLRGYVQLGGGVELTRVSVPYSFERTIRDQKVMPMGFLGFGAEIEVARGTHLGMAFRTLVMGNFDYDPAKLDTGEMWVAAPAPEVVFDASPDLANQGQFYLRRDL